jgi:subtilisin-like proprotein convertase family protein
MRSAAKVNSNDPDWWTNSAGVQHNYKFGAGLVNAGAAVALATNWINLAPLNTVRTMETNLSISIPDNNQSGITRTFTISNVGFRVERVALTVTAPHQCYGDLAITLVSPSGTQSRLAENHTSSGPGYEGWTLTKVRHWGEQAKGTWTVHIADLAPSKTGTLEALDVLIQGSSPRAFLSGMVGSGGQYLTLRAAAPGWTYLLETSADLRSWGPLRMLKLDLHGRALFVDMNLADHARFYRARLLQ